MHFHIGLNARRVKKDRWGDTAYAQGLARALEAQGHRATLFFRDEAPVTTGAADVVLWIIGPYLPEPIAGLPNLLWVISPPNLAPQATLARFSGIYVASQDLAERYAAQGLPAHYLPQGTDTDLFTPTRRLDGAPDLPIVFVGRHAPRAPRAFVKRVIAAGAEVQIWGPGWEGVVPDHLIQGRYVAPEDLPALYARARVVLNDHMGQMAALGMMSNRCYDAIAAGASVLSDAVVGAPEGLPITMLRPSDPVEPALAAAQQPVAPAERLARHRLIRDGYSFALCAERLIAGAQGALRAPPSPPACVVQDGARTGPVRKVALRLTDLPCDAPPEAVRSITDAPPDAPLQITLYVSDPATGLPEEPQNATCLRAAQELWRVTELLGHRARIAGLRLCWVQGAPALLHPMMTRLRAAQALLSDLDAPDLIARAAPLAAAARRLIEASTPSDLPLSAMPVRSAPPETLHRVINGLPLYEDQPQGFDRDRHKHHLLLRPRQNWPRQTRPLGVVLLISAPEQAPRVAAHLAHLNGPKQVYVACPNETLAEQLRPQFPEAVLRVVPPAGSPIWTQIDAFPEAIEAHDLLLYLHTPPPAAPGDLLPHALNALLPSPEGTARLLSLFGSVPRLGMVAPVVPKALLALCHWGANFEIAQELHQRGGWSQPLPGEAGLRFAPSGMFWARSAALRPLAGLPITAAHLPAQHASRDGTLGSALLRLAGASCAEAGYQMLRVAGAPGGLYPGFQMQPQNNRAVRDALEAG